MCEVEVRWGEGWAPEDCVCPLRSMQISYCLVFEKAVFYFHSLIAWTVETQSYVSPWPQETCEGWAQTELRFWKCRVARPGGLKPGRSCSHSRLARPFGLRPLFWNIRRRRFWLMPRSTSCQSKDANLICKSI